MKLHSHIWSFICANVKDTKDFFLEPYQIICVEIHFSNIRLELFSIIYYYNFHHNLLFSVAVFGVSGKCPKEKSLPEEIPQENFPQENLLPLHARKLTPGKISPKNCFTSFLLLLTLSYSCSFLNFL